MGNMGIFDFLRWGSPKLEKRIDKRRAKLGKAVIDSEFKSDLEMLQRKLDDVKERIYRLKLKKGWEKGLNGRWTEDAEKELSEILKPLYKEEVDLQIKIALAKKPKPLVFLKKRLENSYIRDKSRYQRQKEDFQERVNTGITKTNEVPGTKDWHPKEEHALQRLLETYYLMHPSKVPASYVRRELAKPENTKIEAEIRQQVYDSQKRSLMGWVDYFRTLPGNFLFMQYVITEVLHYDFYFLSRDLQTGKWKNERRKDLKDRRNYCGAFPQFESDFSPLILSRMSTYIDASDDINVLRQKTQDEKIIQAVQKKDFREMYFYIRERVLEEKRVLEGLKIVPGEGKWLNDGKPFSIKGLDIDKPKDKEKIDEQVYGVMRATQYSKGQCIKEYKKGLEYLKDGDIYIYSVNKTDIEGKVYPVSAIAIHVFNDGRINSNEIHGDGESQGIEPEYLEIARAFVNQKEKIIGEDGIEREEYRFANAQEFDIKFADTIMYNRVKDKVEKLGKSDENGKPYPDLEPNELKFLYQIYRPVEGFELGTGGGLKNKVDALKHLRLQKIGNKKVDLITAEKEQMNIDLIKMFSCLPENVYYKIRGQAVDLKELTSNIKVVVGDLFRESVSVPRGMSPWDFVFSAQSELEVVTGTMSLDMTQYPKNLKEVAGITITPEDRKEMEESAANGFGSIHFPSESDSRVGKYIYE